MWEIIKANNRKSIILFVSMAACLLLLGYVLGEVFYPQGGMNGLFVAAIIWIIMSIISYTSADSILLSVSHAVPVTHDVHPQLFNVTEEMKIASNLPAMPKLYIMHEQAPNAFATGLKVEKSAIVVTNGLLERLNRDELQGVIAHEMAHILNRDVRFITFAGILLGSITLISEVFLRGMFYSSLGRSRRFSSRSSSGGGGQGQAVMMIVAIVLAILAPLMANILYFAISRKREYLADATAARLTRYPAGLAAALEKISKSTLDLKTANKVTAPMYIANPLKKKGMALSNLTSTHPPINERIKILRNMMHGVNYNNYQEAYAKVKDTSNYIIPGSGLKDRENITIRKATRESPKPKSRKSELRNMSDLMRAANGFAFIACACGLKVKVPPNFKKSKINCPRCQRQLKIPVMEMAAMGQVMDRVLKPQKAGGIADKKDLGQRQIFERKTKGWESVQCNCGHLMQISPLFVGTNMNCLKCQRTIAIKS